MPPAWAAVGANAKAFVPSPSTRGAAQRGRRRPRPCSAKNSGSEERGAGGGLLSRGALLRSGAALFALSFVDAGYSGDWSRIGAISKDSEDLLKLGAYCVVPLCIAFVFSSSSKNRQQWH